MPKPDAVSRRKFIAVGGGTSLAAFLAACGGGGDTTTMMTDTTKSESEPMKNGGESETEQFGKGDIGILNYALTLEYLEAAFYKDVVKSGLFKGEELAVLKKFGAEEQQHVEALEGTIKKLGGKPVAKPTFNFEYGGTPEFLTLAETFENTGVSAFNGAAPMIESKEVLGAAGSIVQVEARHAAAIALRNGQEPSPSAFDAPLDEKQVLKAVEPFIA